MWLSDADFAERLYWHLDLVSDFIPQPPSVHAGTDVGRLEKADVLQTDSTQPRLAESYSLSACQCLRVPAHKIDPN